MTGINTPIGGTHRQEDWPTRPGVVEEAPTLEFEKTKVMPVAKSPSVTPSATDGLPWFMRFIPGTGYGFGWNLLALALLPISVVLVFIGIAFKFFATGEDWLASGTPGRPL